MAASSIIKVVALADVSRLVGGMKKAGQSVQNFESKGLASFKNFAKGAAAGGAVMAISGLVDGLKSAVTAASDLGESVNAVNVAFGSNSKEILAMGKDAAKSLGLSSSEFNSLAVGFSAFTEKIAGQGGDVAGTFKELSTRGADFASVFNVKGGVNESMELFRSGLAGETEPLRKYGIDMSAAAVEAYALSNGIVQNKNDLDETTKVQARYGLLMEQTSKTQGDFANTSGSLANQTRILGATMEDVKASIGEALLPTITNIVAALMPMVEKLAPVIIDLVTKLAPILDSVVLPLIDFVSKLLVDLQPVIDIVMDLVLILMDLLAPILEIVGVIFEKVAEAVVALLEPLMPIVEELMPIFITILEILMKVLEPVLAIIVLLAKAIGKGLGKAFKGLMPILDIAMVALEALLDIVTGIVDGAMAALKWLGGVLGIDLSEKAGVGAGVNTTTMEGILAASGGAPDGKKPGDKKPPKPPGGGKGNPALEAAKKALEGAIKTLQTKLDEARQLVADTVAKFRDSVDTAFGLVQRGSGMVFRADRYIRELKRMKAATADFNSNLKKLRDMGGKAANPLLEQILSKSPEEAAAIMRSFTASPEMFAEAIKTTNDLAATGGMVGNQLNAMSGNQTQAEMLKEMKLLREDLAKGKNTYNVKATMTAVEIVNQIKAWEKSTGKKVLAG